MYFRGIKVFVARNHGEYGRRGKKRSMRWKISRWVSGAYPGGSTFSPKKENLLIFLGFFEKKIPAPTKFMF